MNDGTAAVMDELASLRREIESMREEMANNQNIQSLDREAGPRQVHREANRPQMMTCLVCKKTKELPCFQLNEKRKNKFGAIVVYTKKRTTCGACYARRARENKKARK